ncbi:uncharacterized protein A1O5_02517 [Cladophialophora psammophila CBS 110553]|uniref:NADAR domain-containing protein n=1 Tax=Cladophialophora psammophila CBS 110553 TaxID=1182543 RepID=W9X171_9EURO|nr:uncharacterized protein A1O5_02517 [Cladophialophora psammophila CBS 110553]EXJ74222.1 hypothetical protein A1O5_02517 [Cladophialophora psammophila CBS 110553]
METQPESNVNSYVFLWRTTESYGELSQWYHTPFVFDEKRFANMEQFVMHYKAVVFNNMEIADRILNSFEAYPAEHMRMGRMIRGFDEAVWRKVCMDIVVTGYLCKFTQNEVVKNVLMSTGKRVLVEASPADSNWGIGFDRSNAIANMSMWGSNKLGRALMVVRDPNTLALITCQRSGGSKVLLSTEIDECLLLYHGSLAVSYSHGLVEFGSPFHRRHHRRPKNGHPGFSKVGPSIYSGPSVWLWVECSNIFAFGVITTFSRYPYGVMNDPNIENKRSVFD